MSQFHASTLNWFRTALGEPTAAQTKGWASITGGSTTLIQAPTGSGKTLAAFLWAIDRLMFEAVPPAPERCRVLYVSPLKALAVDVERNLRSPLAGIARQAGLDNAPHHVPTVAVRSGDTPPSERARFRREPADILITTPESLYLLLTSSAREALRSVRTLIIDEVHALVATKRGAHLALSMERLEALAAGPVQRVGLSATQRPLDEVARFLGGAERAPGLKTRPPAGTPPPGKTRPPLRWSPGSSDPGQAPERDLHGEFQAAGAPLRYRPVTIVDTGERKRLELRIEVPIEDMARIGDAPDIPSGPASQPAPRRSIWTAIHPRLLDLVRRHRSTLIFVNSRRVAERLAGAINELAGEPLVRAHHGSIARDQRVEIEDALKGGRLRGLVATSSLELGIDMGAIDLVVQIEAPPSVASGLQRAGRGGHQVHATSRAILFPKFRGDLLSCAAVSRAMHDGLVESTRYPRNPLDVLAQQIVAMTSVDRWQVEDLFDTVRQAAPFAELSRPIFEGVLDMLSGRYPSDEFAELKPRVTWDRLKGTVTAREGAGRVAIVSGGTIPDRGLYGVFLAGAAKGAARVGELDEEMVFESRVGETFVLGATTWRIEDISHDRVVVSPAPGEPGKMPFWKADAPGRPLEFGMRIGELVRRLRDMPAAAAIAHLVGSHDLDRPAAENLVRYLDDQAAAAGAVPDDRTIIVERCRDDLGDWRVCVLSPLGSRVHAPWAMAATARIRAQHDLDVETMWTDDGFVVRFPDTDEPPDVSWLVPPSGEAEHLVVSEVGSTAFFAARFREAAGRALLLPRRRPGVRAPLWQQRKRASDLLAVASRYGSFPIVLETYRECLRDDFDMPALIDVLRRIEQRSIRLVTHDADKPSPFAASLLFGYVANYLYDGDAPLAERRAQALAIDQAQLRDLIGAADLRELLDGDVLDDLERDLQRLDARYPVESPDRLHDLLLRLGDLTRNEMAARGVANPARLIRHLAGERRIVDASIGGEKRYLAVEHASQYRDALGIALPAGLPESLLAPVDHPLDELAMRFARTHGPFGEREVAARYAVPESAARAALGRLAARARVVEGSFRPGGTGREWCAPDVLRLARQRSMAKLRRAAAPVEAETLGRLLIKWHGIRSTRRGLNALLDAIETLQGAPLPASLLETAILPARVSEYDPGDLDTLASAGEITWVGLEPLGQRDGRLALYLTDHLPGLLRPRDAGVTGEGPLADRQSAILEALARQGASFFGALHDAAGGGYPGETLDALWALVWRGLVTNDTFQPLRRYVRPPERTRKTAAGTPAFRSRRLSPPSSEGRWTLVPEAAREGTATAWAAATADQLLSRHGVLTREAAGAENIPGGFTAVYPVLRAMEESGRIRRGYFVSGVAATQFARPAAVDMLRALRTPPDEAEAVWLAATDPANPYGAVLKWPSALGVDEDGVLPAFARAVGTSVVLVDGALAAFLRAGNTDLGVFLPEADPDRSRVARALSSELAAIAAVGEGRRGGLLIASINGRPAGQHLMARHLTEAGFVASSMGYYLRRDRGRGPGTGDRLANPKPPITNPRSPQGGRG